MYVLQSTIRIQQFKKYPMKNILLSVLLSLQLLAHMSNAACNRRPLGALGKPSRVDESFKILIDGNPQTYVFGQRYLLSLSCASTLTFTAFTLIVENEQASNSTEILGHFEIINPTETRFSTSCDNMIENTNTYKKVKIEVAWIAPTDQTSDCIMLKAAVVQHRNVWFTDDGFLTKQLCPEEIDDVNHQTPKLSKCCACDEAKYEIRLERKWNRNTHPKDFPHEAWRTQFSELIGASHTYDYRFWDYGQRASHGLKSLAEYGSTEALSEEIKKNLQLQRCGTALCCNSCLFQEEDSESGSVIRTVIKAPGIPYRANYTSSTMAAVRVDSKHHLISFVSKIIPSPDWIIGVSAMELCLANCTWAEQKVLNLYPWDVGVDAGTNYLSSAQPQIPDVVRRISASSDYRSPFYDESAPMKPLATLYVTRKRIYEKYCEEDEYATTMECSTHPWNDWSECNVKCGPGTQVRIRSYKDSKLAERFKCQEKLSQTERCMGQQCSAPAVDQEVESDNDGEEPYTIAECELTRWSNWSPCSKTCGKGIMTRTRGYRNPQVREKCQSVSPLKMIEQKVCYGEQCGGSIPDAEDDDAEETNSRQPVQSNWWKAHTSSNRYNAKRMKRENQVGQERKEEKKEKNKQQ